MRLRVLDFLRGDFADRSDNDEVQVEYRLICNGVVHRDIVGDWTKSDAARLLSTDRFDLIVTGFPIDRYPQELALRFVSPTVHETYGTSSFIRTPDNEIAADLCVLLTLFARRLIVPAVKVREVYADPQRLIPPNLRDFPHPIRRAAFASWSPRPASILTTPEVVDGEWRVRQEVRSYEPLPVAIGPEALRMFLENIGRQPDDLAARMIAAARRYHTAMRFIPNDPDLAYQLLISAIETVSNFVLRDHTPPPSRMMESRGDLVGHLRKL